MKTKIHFSIFFGVMLFISAMIILIMDMDDIPILFKKPVNLLEEAQNIEDFREGVVVESDIELLVGSYAIRSDSMRAEFHNQGMYYYFFPVYLTEGMRVETYYLTLEVHSSDTDFAEYQKLVEETKRYLDSFAGTAKPDVVHVYGELEKLEPDVYNEMKNWFQEEEWLRGGYEFEEKVLQLKLKPIHIGSLSGMIYMAFFLAGIGIAFVVGGVVLAMQGKVRKKEETL